MNLCNDGHNEVCYEGKTCPVCDMESAKDKVIREKEDRITELEDEINGLQDK